MLSVAQLRQTKEENLSQNILFKNASCKLEISNVFPLICTPLFGVEKITLLGLGDHRSSVRIRFAPPLPYRAGLSIPQNLVGVCAMTAQSLLGRNSCHVWAANAEGKYLDLKYELKSI